MKRTLPSRPEKNPWGLPDIGIPAEVLFHPELTASEKILFGFIRNLSKSEKGCWASNKWLGDRLGVTGRTITGMVANLKKYKIINVEYLILSNKKEGRRIFVNSEYPKIYGQILEGEGEFKDLHPIALKFYPHRTKVLSPMNKSSAKEEKEEERIKKIKNLSQQPENSIKERNKSLLPLTRKLGNIIQSNKNIKIDQTKLNSWANEIRKLVETDGVDPTRLEKVLDWYSDNIGGEYIPVVESGASLRNKFIRLEDAMKRTGGKGSNSQTKSAPQSPRKIISRYFKSKDMTGLFITNCFQPAKNLLHLNGGADKAVLAEHLIELYDQIKVKQEKYFSSELVEILPEYGPMSIISAYVKWVGKQDWITNKRISVFKIDYKPFHDFCGQYASEVDSKARHPLTGTPINKR